MEYIQVVYGKLEKLSRNLESVSKTCLRHKHNLDAVGPMFMHQCIQMFNHTQGTETGIRTISNKNRVSS